MDSEWDSSNLLETIGTVSPYQLQAGEYVEDINLESWNPGGLDNLFPGELGDLLASIETTEYCEGTASKATAPQRHVNLPDGDTAYDQSFNINLSIFNAEEAFDTTVGEFEFGNPPKLAGNQPVASQEMLRESQIAHEYSGSVEIAQSVCQTGCDSDGRPYVLSSAAFDRNDKHAQESDSSWDEQDNLGHFCASIKQRLNHIADQDPDIERHFITEYLPRKKRQLVHTLAHMGRFNHMTLDRSKERRVLVSTATIGCRGDTTPKKCWNKGKSIWKLDPRTLILMCPSSIARDQLGSTLIAMDLPVPQSYCQLVYSCQRRIFLARFSTAGIAATVLDHLETKSQSTGSEQSLHVQIDASYRYWNPDAHVSQDATFKSFGDTGEQQAWQDKLSILPHRFYSHTKTGENFSRRFTIEQPAEPTYRRRHSRRNSSRGTEASDGDGYGSSNSRSSSKRSYTAYMSDTSQRVDGATVPVSGSFLTEDERLDGNASSDSVAKRRKRLPKQAGGYTCREPECEKTFDFNGERTKHERIHKPKEEYPHACGYCEKRFINRKDLTRHERTHMRTWFPNKSKS